MRARESRFVSRVLGLASHYRETLSREASRMERERERARARADLFHVSRIHGAPGFAAIAPGDGGIFSLLVERTCPIYPPSFPRSRPRFSGAYPHLFRHKCAEGDPRRTTRDSLSSSRRHPSRRIARQTRKGRTGKREGEVDERSGIKCKKDHCTEASDRRVRNRGDGAKGWSETEGGMCTFLERKRVKRRRR